MKVSATLKGRPDSFGRRTIYLRINEGFNRSFQATDMKVKSTDFSKGKVRASHPDYQQLNRKILSKIMEVEAAGGFVKEEKKQLSFFDYATACLNGWHRQKHPDTLRHYTSSVVICFQL